VREVRPDGLQATEKTAFSCCGDDAVSAALKATGRDQWVVCGMEAHVCVFQTVRDLRARGWTVQVPRDAVLSRAADDLATGLALAERAGAVVTSIEAVLFDLLRRAGSPEFKAISALVK
jgi:nicotinamidase-related amidase